MGVPAYSPRRHAPRLSPIFPRGRSYAYETAGRQSDAMHAMHAAMHAGRFMCTDILMLVIQPIRQSSIRVTGQKSDRTETHPRLATSRKLSVLRSGTGRDNCRTRRNLTVSSLVGGDRKLYVSLKLGVPPVAAAAFAAARSAWSAISAPLCRRLLTL